MSNQHEEDDFMGSGASLKFEKIGVSHSGKLVSIKARNDQDINGKTKTWDDGTPKKVFLWQLEDKDGELATMWVRGNLVKVLREAAVKAGAKKQSDLIGATVQVKHHALGEAQKGMQPAKLFQAKITLATPEERAAMAARDEPDARASGTATDAGQEDYDPFGDTE